MTLKDKVKNIPPAVRAQLMEKYKEKHKREGLTWLDYSEVYMFAEHYSDPNRYSQCPLPPPVYKLQVSPRAFLEE